MALITTKGARQYICRALSFLSSIHLVINDNRVTAFYLYRLPDLFSDIRLGLKILVQCFSCGEIHDKERADSCSFFVSYSTGAENFVFLHYLENVFQMTGADGHAPCKGILVSIIICCDSKLLGKTSLDLFYVV